MVKESEHITIENAKEFYFEHGCGSYFFGNMDPRIMEFYNLKIEREILDEWTNEYYELKLDSFATQKNKGITIIHIIHNYQKCLNYNLMRRYFVLYLNSMDEEDKDYGLLLNLLEKNSNNEENGIIYISYINDDYELMYKAIDMLKRQIIELDGVEMMNAGVKGLIIETERYSKYLNEFIEEHNITLQL